MSEGVFVQYSSDIARMNAIRQMINARDEWETRMRSIAAQLGK